MLLCSLRSECILCSVVPLFLETHPVLAQQLLLMAMMPSSEVSKFLHFTTTARSAPSTRWLVVPTLQTVLVIGYSITQLISDNILSLIISNPHQCGAPATPMNQQKPIHFHGCAATRGAQTSSPNHLTWQ